MGVIYEAFFINNGIKGKLENDIELKHVTTEFRPKVTHEEFYGSTAVFEVIGYGNDSINEGYLVKPISGDAIGLLDSVEVPHITLSVSTEGKPVNTKNLDFHPCERFQINATFNAFVGKWGRLW